MSGSTPPYLGQIMIVAFNFAPRGFALCNGQLLPINTNQPLFSLLGTRFGGDGVRTFALPDFRGRTAMHQGNGHLIGDRAGNEQMTLISDNLPAHTHPITATLSMQTGDAATTDLANGAFPAAAAAGSPRYSSQGDDMMKTTEAYFLPSDGGTLLTTEFNTPSGTPFNNIMPYLALTFIIALQGAFPTRN